jgi:hypothetical protein
MAAAFGNQLNSMASGDPRSAAQQQLSSGYGAANDTLRSNAASMRGGPLATAMARRTADNSIAANSQARAVASQDLMARERMGAYGQLSGLGGAMRKTDQDVAFGQANDALKSSAINDAEQARREGLRMGVGALGMQGRSTRENMRGNWRDIMYGGDAISANLAQANRDNATNIAYKTGSDALGAAGGLANGYTQDPDEAAQKKQRGDFVWS